MATIQGVASIRITTVFLVWPYLTLPVMDCMHSRREWKDNNIMISCFAVHAVIQCTNHHSGH